MAFEAEEPLEATGLPSWLGFKAPVFSPHGFSERRWRA